MKLLVSWLRDFVDVSVPIPELASLLSMRGFEVAAIDPPPPGPLAPPWDPASAGLGTPASALPDAVIDFEITANRPDCLSVIGLAREAATTLRVPLKPLPGTSTSGTGSTSSTSGTSSTSSTSGTSPSNTSPALSVFLDDPDLCPRYAAAVVDVRVAPSPAWLVNRLTAAGVRPINNVVDVTNYVLIELGHPLHAFDLDRLEGRQLRARRARAGERLRTLDGEDRELSAEMLVIADQTTPQGLAGIMGGAASEVWSGTRTIALESAYFKPASIRRTSKRLGLSTEASSRFERGADINLPAHALDRACALMELIGAGRRRGGTLDCYPAPRQPVTVGLRRDRIAALLGVPIADADVEAIFAGLGFAASPAAGGWDVRVPTARVDIAREADLIEEVGRHYGFDRIPSTFPALRETPPRPDPAIIRTHRLRTVMTAAGFSEAIGYSFIERAAAAPFASTGPADAPPGAEEADRLLVPLAYPLSELFAVLRPSLLPGLLDGVVRNRRRDTPDVRLFEIGSCFSSKGGERQRLALAWAGAGRPAHWATGDEAVDFFHVKGAIERLGQALRVPLRFEPATAGWLVPGRAARVSSGATPLGLLGQLLPALADARQMPGNDPVYVAELDLEALHALVPATDVQVTPLPRFPSVVRDVSIVVDEGLPSEQVRATIRSAAPDTLVSIREFDRYQGQGIPEGRCSLSLRLTFRAPDRTLTDAEVQQAMEGVLDALKAAHQAVQR
ncbi:MAG TPA: phenylalanine--tRNA ligase subunit beta [Vicinamibacterales bacterium]|nr:phenylalanine--tRNA ligase subunit beta [Vicinamibacterales bacterium]